MIGFSFHHGDDGNISLSKKRKPSQSNCTAAKHQRTECRDSLALAKWRYSHPQAWSCSQEFFIPTFSSSFPNFSCFNTFETSNQFFESIFAIINRAVGLHKQPGSSQSATKPCNLGPKGSKHGTTTYYNGRKPLPREASQTAVWRNASVNARHSVAGKHHHAWEIGFIFFVQVHLCIYVHSFTIHVAVSATPCKQARLSSLNILLMCTCPKPLHLLSHF